MNFFACVMLISFSSCLAHYRGSYESRNLITREEPSTTQEVIIECPVCEESDHWSAATEECPIRRGNKGYKICRFGTYTNEVCGKRTDCFRGPKEQCTEKREFDRNGIKCAPGFYCHKWEGVCTGPDDRVGYWPLQRQFVPYTGRQSELRIQPDDSKFSFEGIRN